jgi:hypothetical protein
MRSIVASHSAIVIVPRRSCSSDERRTSLGYRHSAFGPFPLPIAACSTAPQFHMGSSFSRNMRGKKGADRTVSRTDRRKKIPCEGGRPAQPGRWASLLRTPSASCHEPYKRLSSGEPTIPSQGVANAPESIVAMPRRQKDQGRLTS